MPEFQKAPQLTPYHFPKGTSGNPGGLPKQVAQARRLAAQACPEAIETLKRWMAGDDARASIAACMALLERGLGKAAAMRELYPAKQQDAAQLPEVAGLSDSQLERIIAIAKEGLT